MVYSERRRREPKNFETPVYPDIVALRYGITNCLWKTGYTYFAFPGYCISVTHFLKTDNLWRTIHVSPIHYLSIEIRDFSYQIITSPTLRAKKTITIFQESASAEGASEKNDVYKLFLTNFKKVGHGSIK